MLFRSSIEQFKKEKLITEELYNHLNNILYLKEIEADRELKKDTTLYHQLEIGINDKYIHYASYHEYLNHYLWNFNHHVKDITHIQGSYNDWKQTFDELSRKNFQLKSLQLLLANCIRNIGENFNVNELNEYLEKYITITKDSTLHHELYCEYNLSANANQLLLEDNLNKRSNFEELLKELKGKVIYIDFWASWCASCKAEMEPSAKLRHEFKDKDIAFVYLAYNDKKDNWRASLEKQKLSNQPYSFFILNSKNSKLLQELKVNLIPRFIIIDKQGNIVNANAPRPGSTDIVNILKQYL